MLGGLCILTHVPFFPMLVIILLVQKKFRAMYVCNIGSSLQIGVRNLANVKLPERFEGQSTPCISLGGGTSAADNRLQMFLFKKYEKLLAGTSIHWCWDEVYRLNFIQYRTGVLAMLQEPSSRTQPQYWMKFLDPCVQDFYPVLGCSLAPS